MASKGKKGKGDKTLEQGKAQQDPADRPEKSKFDAEIRELFQLFDKNNDKTISALELGKAMRFLGMSPKQSEVDTAMRTLDKNGNGRIEFKEFYNFMQAELSVVNQEDFMNKEETVRGAFQIFDRDGNGYIDAKELRAAMKNLGEALTDKELDDMMKEADVDGDGKINYEEFVKIWCETK